jgi:F-type H+-transporting ATPase subunit b
MKTLMKYSFMFAALSASAIANESGAHHEPSITDLAYPAINFIVLVGFLIWKLKKPVVEMFNKKESEVRSLMNSAEEKSKLAKERLSSLEAKMKNLDSEISKIKSDYESDVANFSKTQSVETQATIARVKRDLENKIEGERNGMVEKINQDLINKVIEKTQETIKGNADMKSRATSKIVAELR